MYNMYTHVELYLLIATYRPTASYLLLLCAHAYACVYLYIYIYVHPSTHTCMRAILLVVICTCMHTYIHACRQT